MAGDYGELTSLGDTEPMVRQVLALLHTLDPKMHVLLNLIKRGEPVDGISGKIEWLEKNVHAQTGTINEALDNSETGVDVASGEGVNFGVGDIFIVDDEYFQVTVVTTDTLTVKTRGSIMGSAAATHDTATAWRYITNAQEEDATMTARGYRDATAYFNWIQTFAFPYQETFVSQNLNRYGGTSKLDDMLADALIKCRSSLNRGVFEGVRAQFASNVSGILGGMATYIPKGNDDSDFSSDTITEKIINDAFDDVIAASGDKLMPATIVCTYPMKQAIAKEYIALNSFNRDGGSKVAGLDIDQIVTPYGNIDLVADPDCQTGRIWLLRLADIEIHAVPNMEWQTMELAVDKLATKKVVYGTYSMTVERPNSMIYLNGLSESYT